MHKHTQAKSDEAELHALMPRAEFQLHHEALQATKVAMAPSPPKQTLSLSCSLTHQTRAWQDVLR